jgi:uncharacterized membrane protein
VSERGLRAGVAALALAGVGITSYLVAIRYSDASLLCSTGGCATVQHSRYAKVAGVPVAVLGLAGYLAILASAVLRSSVAAVAGAAVALVGFVFGVYLIWAQLARIHATCEWCLASDGILTMLLVLTALRLRGYGFELGRGEPVPER